MKILYVDIDSLRPDHLGCYGYSRNTSPTIDQLARTGVRFENVYASDSPCLPSRMALWSGRCGFRTGVVGHGGSGAEPFRQGLKRGFRDEFHTDGWMTALRVTGHFTAAISSFAERHSAWYWHAGFNEIINPGLFGMDSAEQVASLAMDWLRRRGREQRDWFLHVNFWDTHTPYRVPASFPDHFTGEPGPDWLDADRLARFWASFGPHSAREPTGYDGNGDPHFPRQPGPIETLADARAWWDGYDTGLRYLDDWLGRLFAVLDEIGIAQETTIVISADHGENLGELNVWADHETADQFTCRVPLIIHAPSRIEGGRVDRALRYHIDMGATLIELAGGRVPDSWDGNSFAATLTSGQETGREFLVTSHGAWSCQRAIRFARDGHDFICIVTYHDGYKDFPPVMLFDLTVDPHELDDLAATRPDLVEEAFAMLARWLGQMMLRSESDVDPLMRVLREGGPFHTRGELPAYLERLRKTGREDAARRLAARHRQDL
jgi:choline-sulfatase